MAKKDIIIKIKDFYVGDNYCQLMIPHGKRVVLLFKIAKDGRMLSCRVFKSSGLQSADQAAIRAVELTAPFRPLPADFRGSSIDIQFTFDYNVFGVSGR